MVWILQTGFWNDAGVWVDGNVWIDGGGTPSTTVLTSTPDPSAYLQAVTFTAVVTGAGGTPTGIVTFLDGASPIGTGSLVSGTATLTTPSLAIGSHATTAVYGGDVTFAGSTSAPLTQVVYSSQPPQPRARKMQFHVAQWCVILAVLIMAI